MKRNELVILVVLLILATLWPLFCNWYYNDYVDRKYEQAARSRPGVTGYYEPLLLSHRLIEFDRLSGIASEERASLAFGNTQAWFSDVRKQCIKSLSNQDSASTEYRHHVRVQKAPACRLFPESERGK